MKVALVIPVYNEETHITGVLKEALKTKLTVYVVNDGSRDKSLNKINSVKNRNLIVLNHKINLGKGAALKTGADAAFEDGADAVIFMDSDGQHKFLDLSKFLKALESGNEIALGTRNLELGVPLIRYFGNKIASLYVNLLFGIYVSDLICGYRALTRKAYEKTKWKSSGYDVETEMVVRMSKHRLKYCEVPVETVYLDKFKGVTILDAFGIFFKVLEWRFKL